MNGQITPADRNEVVLTGRLSAPPAQRTLRTGARLTTFRLIVQRPAGPVASGDPGTSGEALAVRRQAVDVVECAVWEADLVRSLAAVEPGDRLIVHGALRRRFARTTTGGAKSWFNVEVTGIAALLPDLAG